MGRIFFLPALLALGSWSVFVCNSAVAECLETRQLSYEENSALSSALEQVPRQSPASNQFTIGPNGVSIAPIGSKVDKKKVSYISQKSCPFIAELPGDAIYAGVKRLQCFHIEAQDIYFLAKHAGAPVEAVIVQNSAYASDVLPFHVKDELALTTEHGLEDAGGTEAVAFKRKGHLVLAVAKANQELLAYLVVALPPVLKK